MAEEERRSLDRVRKRWCEGERAEDWARDRAWESFSGLRATRIREAPWEERREVRERPRPEEAPVRTIVFITHLEGGL